MHRSLEPRGALPQQAVRLDALGPLVDGEFAIDVEYLNIDSASYRQIRMECDGDAARMSSRVLEIVGAAGKMHNPVTGSGGMLVGTVAELGGGLLGPPIGSRVATLVSLTLTPLVLDEVISLDPASEKIGARGRAIVFASGVYATLPVDLPERVALGVLDVCGAPAWAARAARDGMRVVVIGAGGKSGVLVCAQAIETVGPSGRVLGLCWPPETCGAARAAGAEAIAADGTDAIAVLEAVTDAFDGRLADLVFVCSNVPGCEGGAILAAEDAGRVVFFSMATSFTAAALTAEGLGKSCELTIGNGFVPGHAELALDLVRGNPQLMELFGA